MIHLWRYCMRGIDDFSKKSVVSSQACITKKVSMRRRTDVPKGCSHFYHAHQKIGIEKTKNNDETISLFVIKRKYLLKNLKYEHSEI
jgi:hypothetical protein